VHDPAIPVDAGTVAWSFPDPLTGLRVRKGESRFMMIGKAGKATSTIEF
jgi:hypothetical protein